VIGTCRACLRSRTKPDYEAKRAIVVEPSAGSRLAPCSSESVSSGHEQDLNEVSPLSPTEVHAVVNRVRGEFIEMPGLRLTVRQAARLWGLEPSACENVIDVLVRASFLRWTPAGMVARVQA
jgi:hypothetical protein